MYDVLRADRCISVNSLEARVPFGDLDFVRYVMAIDPEKKRNHYGKGKYLLRRAFEGDYLPTNILYREKAAFSDAVGHSLVNDLKDYAESCYTQRSLQRSARHIHTRSLLPRSLFFTGSCLRSTTPARRRWWLASGCPTAVGRVATWMTPRPVCCPTTALADCKKRYSMKEEQRMWGRGAAPARGVRCIWGVQPQRAGCGQPDLLRPVCSAAPGTGERRHRGQRPGGVLHLLRRGTGQ